MCAAAAALCACDRGESEARVSMASASGGADGRANAGESPAAATPALRADEYCLPGSMEAAAAMPAEAAGELAAPTSGGSFVVRARFDPDPPRVGELAALVVDVTDADGEVVNDVRVRVDAGMPQHNHGMNVRPRVEQADAGGWRAEGMVLHMPGRWEVYVDVMDGAWTERATLVVRIP
jgi:hypothetical protein